MSIALSELFYKRLKYVLWQFNAWFSQWNHNLDLNIMGFRLYALVPLFVTFFIGSTSFSAYTWFCSTPIDIFIFSIDHIKTFSFHFFFTSITHFSFLLMLSAFLNFRFDSLPALTRVLHRPHRSQPHPSLLFQFRLTMNVGSRARHS